MATSVYVQRDGMGRELAPASLGRDFIQDAVLSTSNKYQQLEFTVARSCAAPVRAGGTDRHSKLPSRFTSRLARSLVTSLSRDRILGHHFKKRLKYFAPR